MNSPAPPFRSWLRAVVVKIARHTHVCRPRVSQRYWPAQALGRRSRRLLWRRPPGNHPCGPRQQMSHHRHIHRRAKQDHTGSCRIHPFRIRVTQATPEARGAPPPQVQSQPLNHRILWRCFPDAHAGHPQSHLRSNEPRLPVGWASPAHRSLHREQLSRGGDCGGHPKRARIGERDPGQKCHHQSDCSLRDLALLPTRNSPQARPVL